MAAIDPDADGASGVDYMDAQTMASAQKIHRPPQISMETCKSWMTNSLRGSENESEPMVNFPELWNKQRPWRNLEH